MTNEEKTYHIETLEQIRFRCEEHGWGGEVEALDIAIEELEQHKVGKWIHWTDDRKDYVTCSCCDYGAEGEVLLSDKTPYCPICGAEMEVKE